jgi:hypothetical protein
MQVYFMFMEREPSGPGQVDRGHQYGSFGILRSWGVIFPLKPLTCNFRPFLVRKGLKLPRQFLFWKFVHNQRVGHCINLERFVKVSVRMCEF